MDNLHAASLAKLRQATQMLAEVRNAQDAKRVIDVAAAAEYYAQKAKLGQDAIEYAHTIKTDAMALLGGFLKVAPEAAWRKGHRDEWSSRE